MVKKIVKASLKVWIAIFMSYFILWMPPSVWLITAAYRIDPLEMTYSSGNCDCPPLLRDCVSCVFVVHFLGLLLKGATQTLLLKWKQNMSLLFETVNPTRSLKNFLSHLCCGVVFKYVKIRRDSSDVKICCGCTFEAKSVVVINGKRTKGSRGFRSCRFLKTDFGQPFVSQWFSAHLYKVSFCQILNSKCSYWAF